MAVNFNAIPPDNFFYYPIKQDVILATEPLVDLTQLVAKQSALAPIDPSRIVVKRAGRHGPKPYTSKEIQAYLKSWGVKPLIRRADLVTQLHQEYIRRYPTT